MGNSKSKVSSRHDVILKYRPVFPQTPIEIGTKRPKREVDLTSLPARVDNVRINGLNRTYDDYVRRVGEGLFKAKNFQEVLLEANE